jgi:molybdenum cofactor biosynthesis enzyme
MVGVGLKKSTSRYAAARGYVWLGEMAYAKVKENNLRKGDVLAVARMAGERLRLRLC